MFQLFGYIYIALHGLLDIILAFNMYRRLESLAPSIGFMFACSVLSIFLFFGIKNERMRGRYGTIVYVKSEPFAYWTGFTLLVVSHWIFTVTMAL